MQKVTYSLKFDTLNGFTNKDVGIGFCTEEFVTLFPQAKGKDSVNLTVSTYDPKAKGQRKVTFLDDVDADSIAAVGRSRAECCHGILYKGTYIQITATSARQAQKDLGLKNNDLVFLQVTE